MSKRKTLMREVEEHYRNGYPRMLPHVEFMAADWLKRPITQVKFHVQKSETTGVFLETIQELEEVFIGNSEVFDDF